MGLGEAIGERVGENVGCAGRLAVPGRLSADYFVATTGSNSYDGTTATHQGGLVGPWLTVTYAVSQMAAGDIVDILGGTYDELVDLANVNGSAGNKYTFRNYLGHTPIIADVTVGVGPYGGLVRFNNSSYIVLDGLDIRDSDYYNVNFRGNTHHIEIIRCAIHDAVANGVWLQGTYSSPCFTRITYNDVYSNGKGGVGFEEDAGGYYEISNNNVHSNTGTDNYDGIQGGSAAGSVHHLVVKNNILYDNSLAAGADPIDLGGNIDLTHHKLVEGNYVYDNGGYIKVHSGSLRTGATSYVAGISGHNIVRFNVFKCAYTTYSYPNPIAVYNNTFVDSERFFRINEDFNDGLFNSFGDSTWSSGSETGRLCIKNNIFWQEINTTLNPFYKGGGEIIWDWDSLRLSSNLYKFDPDTSLWWDNIPYAVTAAGFASYQASSSPDYPDENSIRTVETVANTFEDYANDDYHLVSGSPAINVGEALTWATNAGSSSTSLVVDKSSFFIDGYKSGGEQLTEADYIVIGSNDPVQIDAIDDATNTITLVSAKTWSIDDEVTLEYSGTAPDVGAYQYQAA